MFSASLSNSLKSTGCQHISLRSSHMNTHTHAHSRFPEEMGSRKKLRSAHSLMPKPQFIRGSTHCFSNPTVLHVLSVSHCGWRKRHDDCLYTTLTCLSKRWYSNRRWPQHKFIVMIIRIERYHFFIFHTLFSHIVSLYTTG